MVLRAADGFDLYASATDLMDAGGWVRSSAADVTKLLFSTSIGRYSGGCLQILNNSTPAGNFWMWPINMPQGSTQIVGFSLAITNVAQTFVLFRINSTTNISDYFFSLSVQADGAVQLNNEQNVTLVTTAPGVIPTNGSWCRVEVRGTLGTNETSGQIELRVNGTVVGSTPANIDTFFSGTPSFIAFGGGGGASCDCRIDDVTVSDTTGTAPHNTYLGDLRIRTLSPVADGGVVDWTPTGSATGWDAVDDVPSAANDDTDYVSASAVGDEARFQMSDITPTPGAVLAVQLRARARRDDATARSLRGLVNSGGIEAVGTSVALASSYVWTRAGIITNDPNTGSGWSGSAVNAMQAGFEVTV